MKTIAIFIAGWLLSVWLPVPGLVRTAIAGGSAAVASGVK